MTKIIIKTTLKEILEDLDSITWNGNYEESWNALNQRIQYYLKLIKRNKMKLIKNHSR